jgi:hypothetical protein
MFNAQKNNLCFSYDSGGSGNGGNSGGGKSTKGASKMRRDLVSDLFTFIFHFLQIIVSFMVYFKISIQSLRFKFQKRSEQDKKRPG